MQKEEKKQEQAARAAWMYYVAGKTQQEIAHELGLSRQVAQRLISMANEQGMVNVKITHPISECLQLAQQLQQKYQLQLCQIVPSGQLDSHAVNNMIAVAGAEVMAQCVANAESTIIGVGSGKTLRSVIDALPRLNYPAHQCVSLIGAIARDSSATRYDVPLWLAEKLQCKHFILPAPLYADSLIDKQMWCQHRVYQDVTTKALHADVTFIGIGEVNLGCPLNSEGFITDEQVEKIKKQGAVAELLGHFICADGTRCQTELDETLTSIPLMENTSRSIIAFAGGDNKYLAIKAALTGRWITGLVTDEHTVRKLLADKN
ncbi:sugar-binding transcriptional regulator [Moellerella wisconsensis]|uniref:sugar-binding transcriptional regulator n=1 Tax=Moellerella wisconsensis TaxID=158849 RepID=UPI001F4DF3FD|nr:sugar-binding transcriptional regulator [Moellerella wisconsensis]UNH25315.1 sugar-binding transcriptional regulator [Moellerella wisconsensis]UNH28500.1 sugar-binding transcriptional regulator [Moellerella wisconsensis]WJW82988.1 sugar-binding transcriptional regulator [Moellerella wisconsensis]